MVRTRKTLLGKVVVLLFFFLPSPALQWWVLSPMLGGGSAGMVKGTIMYIKEKERNSNRSPITIQIDPSRPTELRVQGNHNCQSSLYSPGKTD